MSQWAGVMKELSIPGPPPGLTANGLASTVILKDRLEPLVQLLGSVAAGSLTLIAHAAGNGSSGEEYEKSFHSQILLK